MMGVIMGIIQNVITNKVLFISSAFSIILVSLFFDNLYNFLDLRSKVHNWGWVKVLTNFKIWNFKPFEYFDYFIGYLLTLVIINYVLIIVLRGIIESSLMSFSKSYGWTITIVAIILVAYISFVYYHKKSKVIKIP